jgi:hypothetical protein
VLRTLLRKTERLLALSQRERWLLVRAFVGLGVVEVALRIYDLPRLVEAMKAREPQAARSVTPDQLRRAREYAHLVKIASRYHLVAATCLHRSLVLRQLLAREGLPTELRIGVKKDGIKLRAHAWVELDGYPVNDSPADIASFVPLAHGDGRRPTWSSRVNGSPAELTLSMGAGGITWQ